MSGLARVGAAIFAVGLSLTGPHAVGVAAADDADSAAASAGRGPGRAEISAGAPRDGARGPRRAARAEAAPRVSSAVNADAAARQHDPAAQSRLGDVPKVAQESPAEIPDLPVTAIPDLPETAMPIAAVTADTALSSTAPASTAPVNVAPAAADRPGPVTEQAPAIPAVPATAVQTALRAASDVAALLSSALSGGDPAAPPGLPLSWTILAAASRETFAPVGPSVIAIPQVPLVTALKLQEIPVIGPLLITPVVTIVNHIPVLGDLLHPLLGYPLLPPGLAAPRDARVVSFDGTQINAHFMPAAGLLNGHTAPTVLIGSALGMPGATNLDGTPFDLILADLGGETGIANLRNAGYNVVTWDPRGEYFSGGVLQIDSPDFEARDVSTLISWAAEQPEAQLDRPGDPRMGMVGASYGGGVQTVSAATDQRIDAIVPTISWNTLNTSLYKNDVFKTGSGTSLAATMFFTLSRVNPAIYPAVIYGDLTGKMTPAFQDLLAQRGPGAARGFPDLVPQISAPTLLIQGIVDTLVSLQEADTTANALLAQSVPTKVIWFCGGHGFCIHNVFDLSDGIVLEERTVSWLNRYVKGEDVSTGPAFEWVDQLGQHLSTDIYPAPAGEPVVAAGGAGDVLPLVPFIGGSGPMFLVFPIGGTKAINAVNVETPVSTATSYIVGAPTLTLDYCGTGTGDYVYAQLVDDRTGLVLGNQVTPVPVTLDGQPHAVSLALEPVAHTLLPGETVTVQVFSWSANHAATWSLGSLKVNSMRLSLPTTPNPTPVPQAQVAGI